MSKLFIVEDEKVLRDELIVLLSNYGYDCVTSDDYENMVDVILRSNADLVLLDINLPFYDGYYICRELRKVSSVPIIVVTSRNNDMDEIMSMNLGADDYITKPYNSQVLLARISAVLKRSAGGVADAGLEHNGLVLDLNSGIVSYLGVDVELTKNEFTILKILMENSGKIVGRTDIMNSLWQTDEFVDDNTLAVNISRLRAKLERLGIEDFIETRRGKGYIIV